MAAKQNRSGEEDSDFRLLLKMLGKSVADLRKSEELTQWQLAEKVGKDKAVIARFETGPAPNVALRIVYEIADGVGLSVSDLLKLAEPHKARRKHGQHDPWIKAVSAVEGMPPKNKKIVGEIILNVLDKLQC